MKGSMKQWFYRMLPWAFTALFVTEMVVVLLPKGDRDYQVREFGRLPVLVHGRVQPFDSLARNALLQIRSTSDVPLEQVPSWKFWHHPKKLRSTEWLLEVMTRPEVADTRPIFLIHHDELLGELKLQDKGVEKSGLRYYTFQELAPVVSIISEQGRKAGETRAEEQTAFLKQAGKLANAVMLYQRLKVTLQPEGIDGFAQWVAEFRTNLLAAVAASQAGERGENYDKQALERAARPVKELQAMAQYAYALIVPPREPRGRWLNAGEAILESGHSDEPHPAVTWFAAMAAAYRQQQPSEFNRAVAQYRAWLEPRYAREVSQGRAEFYYNRVQAFLHATIIYVCAFVLAGAALLTFGLASGLSESLRRSAFHLVVVAGLVHTFGLVFRMVLEGRPPVTNLYSSAVFIGWGTMVLGLVLERVYRLGVGSLVAAFAGFVTLLIAHNLALGGDTMEMLRAVLDTNFWLATHVVVITLGYSATFFAGLLAAIYILLGVFTPLLGRKIGGGPGALAVDRSAEVEIGQALARMVYAIVCFATLFSFLGTVLGGIWADQSWGRFWGWDPKENGALLIVLWNAIILHARAGSLVRDRGIMNLAIFGNIITGFSWFGVNMLNIGLHSYGFTNTGAEYLTVFVFSQVVLLGNGLVPSGLWRSGSAGETPSWWRMGVGCLGALDLIWLLATAAWAGDIYHRGQAVWFGGVYSAMPWLGGLAKAASWTLAALILLLAALFYLLSRTTKSPPIPSAPIGNGAASSARS